MKKIPLIVHGMQGMGDCIHQRAVINGLRSRYDVYLVTPWPQIYHDMPDVKFIRRTTKLRAQSKNQEMMDEVYFTGAIPDADSMKITYSPSDICSAGGSVVKAMIKSTGLPDYIFNTDFSLPIPDNWAIPAECFKSDIDKPIMIYRPLTVRKEWSPTINRNPDPEAYYELIENIRKDFFMISIADLNDDEWRIDIDPEPDVRFESGQLDFGLMAALVSIADFVWTPAGFMAVLARAVKSPAVCIFGGYENSQSFSAGNSPFLAIDTIAPCSCFSQFHNCNKSIDIPSAKKKIKSFINETMKRN